MKRFLNLTYKKEKQMEISKRNKRYPSELLLNACRNIDWYENEDGKPYAEITVVDDSFFVIFDTPRETAIQRMKDLFPDLSLIDSFVLKDDERWDYDIANIYFSDDKLVTIEYYENKANNQFEVVVYKEDSKWYCTIRGTLKYTNPVCVNDYPNGYSVTQFEKKIIREGWCVYYQILNEVVQK